MRPITAMALFVFIVAIGQAVFLLFMPEPAPSVGKLLFVLGMIEWGRILDA